MGRDIRKRTWASYARPTVTNILLPALLAACGMSAEEADSLYNRTKADNDRVMRESGAFLQDAMSTSWRYSTEEDRIERRTVRIATLINDDPGNPVRHRSLRLGLQSQGDGPPMIYFRGERGNMLECPRTCLVRYRAGNETGSWEAWNSPPGSNDIVLIISDHAMPIIRNNAEVIIEVPSTGGGELTFHTGGLDWPTSPTDRTQSALPKNAQ